MDWDIDVMDERISLRRDVEAPRVAANPSPDILSHCAEVIYSTKRITHGLRD